jgi:hypothetical protein
MVKVILRQCWLTLISNRWIFNDFMSDVLISCGTIALNFFLYQIKMVKSYMYMVLQLHVVSERDHITLTFAPSIHVQFTGMSPENCCSSKLEAQWAQLVSLTFHSALRKLNTELPIGASHQVLVIWLSSYREEDI